MYLQQPLLNRVKVLVKRRVNSYLINYSSPPPIVYFLSFAYITVYSDNTPYTAPYLLFGIAISLILACNFNFLFMMSPFLTGRHTIWAVFVFVLSAVSANEKWKAYLLLLAIGDSVTGSSYALNELYLSLASAFICWETYCNLVFRSLEDNQLYFTGFFALCWFYLASRVSLYLNASYLAVKLLIPIVGIILGYMLINERIKSLSELDLHEINNPRLLAYYIDLLAKDACDPCRLKGKLTIHSRKCVAVDCFCRKEGDKNNIRFYYIRWCYYSASNKFKQITPYLLFEKYLTLLLEKMQIPEVLNKFGCWEVGYNYFQIVARKRLEARIRQYLTRQNIYDEFGVYYVWALDYDHRFKDLSIEVSSILELKLQFWEEVGKSSPLMSILQDKGCKVVERMYQLNKFYHETIRQYESRIYNFNSTILYAVYLLSTTNFHDYAESIIKNTSRHLYSIKINENNVAETMAFRVVDKDRNKTYNYATNENVGTLLTDIQEYDQSAVSGTYLKDPNLLQISSKLFMNHLKNNPCLQNYIVIEDVSSALCKLLHSHRSKLINRYLKYIVPSSYREALELRVYHLLDFQSSNREIVDMDFLNKIIKVPLLIEPGLIVMVRLSLKLCDWFDYGLGFMGVVQSINNETYLSLSDLEGNQLYCELGFDSNFLRHKAIRQYLNSARYSWYQARIVPYEKVNMMINSKNYTVIISSPFCNLFLDEQAIRRNLYPPLHVDVTNESGYRGEQLKNYKSNYLAKCMKKMESVFYKDDVDSKVSNTQSLLSVINVLSSFGYVNSVPLFRRLQIFFALIIVLCLSACLLGKTVYSLPWDGSQLTKHPVNDMLNLIYLHSVLIKTINYQIDYIIYSGTHNQLDPIVNRDFGVSNYTQYILNTMGKLKDSYSSKIYMTRNNVSEVMSSYYNSIFEVLVSVSDYDRGGVLQTQMLKLFDLLVNYYVDLYLLAKGYPFSKCLLFKSFNDKISNLLIPAQGVPIIRSSITSTCIKIFVLSITTCVVMLLLIIPLMLLLRKRVNKHYDIYDLIASVDGALINEEIRKIYFIINIVEHANESREILKLNALHYETNKINSSGRRNSNSNEMVDGLIIFSGYRKTVNEKGYTESVDRDGDRSKERRGSFDSFLSKYGQNKRRIKKPVVFLSKITNSLDHFQHSKEEEGTVQRVTRIKAGELDLTGSEADPKKCFQLNNFIIYLLIILFAAFLVSNGIIGVQYLNRFQDQTDFVLQQANSTLLQSYVLVLVKLFINPLGPFHSTFANFDLSKYLPAHLTFTDNQQPTKVYENCSSTSQLYCSYNYTLTIITQELNSLLDYCYELKLTNSSNTLYLLKLTIYGTSLNEKLYYLSSQMVDTLFQYMLYDSRAVQQLQLYIFLLSTIWALLSLLIGLLIIRSMKAAYIKYVTIISFLNNDMISKNKRVYSFLSMLNKASY